MGKRVVVDEILVRKSYMDNISKIVPFDDVEANDIRMSLKWIKNSKYIHKPLNMDCHLGVLFMILTPDFKSTFLINHRKAQLWIPPGGHVDMGLSLRDAVVRESQEELGLEPKFLIDKPFFLTRTLTTGVNSGHIDVTFWFLIEGEIGKDYKVQNKEAYEGKWFELDKIVDDPNYFYVSRPIKKIKFFFGKIGYGK